MNSELPTNLNKKDVSKKGAYSGITAFEGIDKKKVKVKGGFSSEMSVNKKNFDIKLMPVWHIEERNGELVYVNDRTPEEKKVESKKVRYDFLKSGKDKQYGEFTDKGFRPFEKNVDIHRQIKNQNFGGGDIKSFDIVPREDRSGLVVRPDLLSKGEVPIREWGSKKETFLEVDGEQRRVGVSSIDNYKERYPNSNYFEKRREDITDIIERNFSFRKEIDLDNFNEKVRGFFRYFDNIPNHNDGSFSKGNIFEEDLDSYWRGYIREKYMGFDSDNPILKAKNFDEARRAFFLREKVEAELEKLKLNKNNGLEGRMEIIKKIRKMENGKFIKKFLPQHLKSKISYFSGLKRLDRDWELTKIKTEKFFNTKWGARGLTTMTLGLAAVGYVGYVITKIGLKIAGFVFQDFVNPMKEAIKDPKKAFSDMFSDKKQ